MHTLRYLIALTAISACQRTPQPSEVRADAVARSLLGPAQPYTPLPLVDQAAPPQTLLGTRALAWQVFAQVVAPVAVPAMATTGTVSVPRFITWYSPEDLQRLMGLTYTAADQTALQAGAPITPDAWAVAELGLVRQVDTMPAPIQRRLQTLTSNPLTAADVIGLSGLSRSLFSPGLASAVVRQYADLQDCYGAAALPEPLVPFRRCWGEPLPPTAVTVKTAWLNTRSTFRSFATDAASLAPVMQDGEAGWDKLAKEQELPAGLLRAAIKDQTFALGGMHIVTKDFEDWLWISAWWSPAPESDFGADRPDDVKRLGTPWNEYKICAVSAYAQSRQDVDAIRERYPSLAAAYDIVLGGQNGASWCSNPYIELGAHNQRTNCIGCHQFAGTMTLQTDILADLVRFPQHGTTRQREQFPTDYIWAATQGSMGWLGLLNNHLYFRRP